MPAYVIFIRERTLDQSELDVYAKAAEPSLEGLVAVRWIVAERLAGPAVVLFDGTRRRRGDQLGVASARAGSRQRAKGRPAS